MPNGQLDDKHSQTPAAQPAADTKKPRDVILAKDFPAGLTKQQAIDVIVAYLSGNDSYNNYLLVLREIIKFYNKKEAPSVLSSDEKQTIKNALVTFFKNNSSVFITSTDINIYYFINEILLSDAFFDTLNH